MARSRTRGKVNIMTFTVWLVLNNETHVLQIAVHGVYFFYPYTAVEKSAVCGFLFLFRAMRIFRSAADMLAWTDARVEIHMARSHT